MQTGPLAGTVGNPLQEAVKAAEKIGRAARDQPIVLCLSGGIDSACMLEAFLLAKVKFEAVFLRFAGGFNEYDISTNIEICKARGVSFKLLELDVIAFFESGKYLEISEKYECQSPQIAVHLWLLDQVEGFPVMGGNPVAPVWRDGNWFFLGLPGELHSTYYKYFLIAERPGVPMFFLYTPELIASFFSLDCMRPFVGKERLAIDDYTYAVKCQSYMEGGFSARPRADKYTGFEMLRAHYDQKCNTRFGTGFDEKFRRPLEEKFPFPEKYLQMIPGNYFPATS